MNRYKAELAPLLAKRKKLEDRISSNKQKPLAERIAPMLTVAQPHLPPPEKTDWSGLKFRKTKLQKRFDEYLLMVESTRARLMRFKHGLDDAIRDEDEGSPQMARYEVIAGMMDELDQLWEEMNNHADCLDDLTNKEWRKLKVDLKKFTHINTRWIGDEGWNKIILDMLGVYHSGFLTMFK